MDGYGTLGEPKPLNICGINYTVQRYQGKHKNEFLLRSETGDVYLYENNVLIQEWKEDKNGKKSEEFIRYKNGRVDFIQRFQDILQQVNSKRIVYHKKGLRMEIWSAQTGHLLYHGKYNERRMKEGWGIEYDEEGGNAVLEGIWSKGRLIEVIRCFNGDVMTELKRNGADSLDPTKRIPIYVGGFRYDEDNETFVREGKGCLIDDKNGIATRECEWKNGKEVSGVNLYDGWYDPKWRYVFSKAMIPRPFQATLQIKVTESAMLGHVSLQVSDLKITSNCGNNISTLNLNIFKWLQSIEIGNDCFESVQTFQIVGLNRLKRLRIGNNSFTQKKNGHGSFLSKSFHVLNCESLESIQIDKYSFSDFAGEFELRDLPKLEIIHIGSYDLYGSCSSFSFYSSSFVIRGNYLKL